jgi:hypothetical protein
MLHQREKDIMKKKYWIFVAAGIIIISLIIYNFKNISGPEIEILGDQAGMPSSAEIKQALHPIDTSKIAKIRLELQENNLSIYVSGEKTHIAQNIEYEPVTKISTQINNLNKFQILNEIMECVKLNETSDSKNKTIN